MARIKAVMRRISPMAVEEVIEMQGLSLDHGSHRVMTGDSPLDMGPTEFKLLHFFMTHLNGFTAANSCSIMSGAPMCTLKTGRSTCIFAVCVRRWSTAATTGWCKRYAGQGIVFDPLLMPFPPVDHRFLAEKAFHS